MINLSEKLIRITLVISSDLSTKWSIIIVRFGFMKTIELRVAKKSQILFEHDARLTVVMVIDHWHDDVIWLHVPD